MTSPDPLPTYAACLVEVSLHRLDDQHATWTAEPTGDPPVTRHTPDGQTLHLHLPSAPFRALACTYTDSPDLTRALRALRGAGAHPRLYDVITTAGVSFMPTHRGWLNVTHHANLPPVPRTAPPPAPLALV